MFKLPFIIPDDELELNLVLLLMLTDKLSATSRGTLVLDKERLTIYLYLVKNPHILNNILIMLSKKNIELKSYELSSFKAENNDIETLYDNEIIKKYLQILVSKQLIVIKHNKKIGFVYAPTEECTEIIKKIDSKYLKRVATFINKMEQITTTPVSKINTNLKLILSKDK